MKNLLLFLFSILSFSTFGDDVKINLSPLKPSVNEVFELTFSISTESSSEPEISFSHGSLELVGKSNRAISTRTIYDNGKLSVYRSYNISYELTAKKTGTFFIRDIKIKVDGKLLTHPVYPITVLAQPQEIPSIFLMADVPKQDLYVGEGIVVRYFLYSKGPVSTVDIKRYPKLNNFLKRFLQEADRTERVNYNGEVYLRTQIYAAKLFAEKAGEFTVDPLSLDATYLISRPGDVFGAFGLSRSYTRKSLSSESIKIMVLPLPAPIPQNFLGLVGKHDFDAQFSKTRLIVNEPFQVKITISGEGALENLGAPEILKDKSFEEFEINGDLKITNSDIATKVFDYTFLPLEDLNLPPTQKIFYFFDANSKKYEPITIKIPEITVVGGGNKIQSNNKKSEKSTIKDLPEISNAKESIKNIFNSSSLNLEKNLMTLRSLIPWLNLILISLGALLLIFPVIFKFRESFKISGDKIPKDFKRGRFNLSLFLKWISPLMGESGKSLVGVIQDLDLSQEEKTYFINIIQSNDLSNYSKTKTDFKFTYNQNYFKKLDKFIQSIDHDSNR